MTSTYWLIAGLIVFLLICMLAVFFGRCISIDWNNPDQLDYRAANGGVLGADARAALRAANNTHFATCLFNIATTRREATAAAIRDLGRKPGTPVTPNPHQQGTLPYAAWQSAYNMATGAHAARGAV